MANSLSQLTLRDLMDAGLHFGHQTKRWNPKMKKYIYDKRNGIHIIDITQSLGMLEEALAFVQKIAEAGKKVLFVGTKKQAQEVVKAAAVESDSYYMTHRWLGGTLTNAQTLRKSIRRMRQLEQLDRDNNGELSRHKKEASALRRELEKLQQNLSGVARMDSLPAALFVIDIVREKNAVAEANRLGIPVTAAKKRKICLTVDFFDELGLHQKGIKPEDIRELARTARKAGVDRLVWRVAGLGVAGYHTKRLSTPDWLAKADRSVIRSRTKDGKVPQDERYRPDSLLTKALRTMDPLVEAQKACRAEGLELYFWVDLFDEQNGRWLIEHPEALVRSKTTGKPWPGLRNYANNDAMWAKIEDIEELFSWQYKPDGIYLSMGCHARNLEIDEPDGDFGKLPADRFNLLIRLISERVHKENMKLMVGAPLGKSIDFAVPYMSDNVKYRVELDWKRWIDEGWVDSLVLGDYEWTWDAVPNWKAKGLDTSKLVPGNEPADVFAPEYVDYAKGRVEILFFSSWLSAYAQHHQGASASSLSGAMKMRADTVLKSGADGMLLHEAHTFEYYRGFGTIKEMRRRFDRANRKK